MAWTRRRSAADREAVPSTLHSFELAVRFSDALAGRLESVSCRNVASLVAGRERTSRFNDSRAGKKCRIIRCLRSSRPKHAILHWPQPSRQDLMPENCQAPTGELVELRIPSGRLVVGRLLRREECVIAIDVHSDEIQSLHPGSRIELGSLPPFDLVRLRGSIAAIDTKGIRTILVLNACTENFHWHQHLIERRRSVRVRPTLIEPIPIAIAIGDEMFKGRARDISTDGVAVVVADVAHHRFPTPSEVNLLLRIPHSSHDVSLGAELLSARQFGGGVIYSARFSDRLSKCFASQQRELQNYIVRRQSAMVATEPSAKDPERDAVDVGNGSSASKSADHCLQTGARP